MNELSSLGLILLLALLAGHLVQFLRIPEVVGYILAGVALGPSVLGWVSADNLTALEVLSEVALGLILFSIGSVFEFERFGKIGWPIVKLTMMESVPAAVLVCLSVLALGAQWQVALLLGAIAIATAPASTLMVMRECDASGPLTDMLMGIIAVNNIFCLIVFSLVAATIDLTSGVGSGVLDTLYRSSYALVWQLVGSVALGFLVGTMLAGWATKVHETGEMLILLAGSILLCVGAARILDLSQLVASLAVGATMVNLSRRSRRVFDTLAGTDPPFYAIFFVIFGADLDVSAVSGMGVIGVFYVLSRSAGKFFGARWGAAKLDMPESVRKYLGYGILAQAGLAVGLMLVVRRRFPDFALPVNVVVLASVVIHEMFGPIGARYAIFRAGEARLRKTEPESIWVS
jgi:Kef-type K+ transport system membrane component KefB